MKASLPHLPPPMASHSMRRSSNSDLLHDLQSLNQSLSHPPLQFHKPPQDHKINLKNWKPIRILTHIGMRRMSCLLAVEILSVRNLPESLNGLRLSVRVRKRDSRDGSVGAVPSPVIQCQAQFEETLFVQCHVHCSGGGGTGKPIRIEPRVFEVSVVAVDLGGVDLGRRIVDLSEIIGESMEWGFRVRKRDAVLALAGKAEGGELDLRLGFQILDDGGVGIYNRVCDTEKVKSKGFLSFARGRRKSMNSFSVSALDSRIHRMAIFDGEERASGSCEVVKEIVNNRAEKLSRLMELDSIANEIKDLESIMNKNLRMDEKELDAGEETVTREFLKMLDVEDSIKISAEKGWNQEIKSLLPDLGNGLGPVIQTKDGGFMASMNPFNDEIIQKQAPKLALQISKPFVLRDPRLSSGLEVFQRVAAVGVEELCSKLTLMAAMDELMGKSAEQIAFEGIASAIISGRNKEGASSSAAKSIGAIKRMISAMSEDRKRLSLDDKCSINEDSVLLEEILAFSIQRIEEIAIEALKIQADLAEEEASFHVSPLTGADNPHQILDSAISLDEEEKTYGENRRLTLLVIIQLRDPVRQYEAVGAPLMALIQAIRANVGEEDDEERRYKVISTHVAGLKVRSGEKKNAWNGEKSKLTATQWLVTNGMGKMGKKCKPLKSKLQIDLLWSLSSRIMEDMWLRPMRNPDVKFANQ